MKRKIRGKEAQRRGEERRLRGEGRCRDETRKTKERREGLGRESKCQRMKAGRIKGFRITSCFDLRVRRCSDGQRK